MIQGQKVSLIIPVRYYSERLPGKVLTPIFMKPNLEHIIERALRSKYLDAVILAVTNKQDEWEKIIDWYDSNEFLVNLKPVYLYRGSHDDIMARTADAINFYNHLTDLIVMISHDCTLVCPKMIDKLIERLVEYDADYSGNAITRSWPDGFDVQVFTHDIYDAINKLIPQGHKTRMWTHWNIWHWRNELKNPTIINYEAPKEFFHPDWHLCLDTPEDRIVIQRIFNSFGHNKFTYKDIIRLMTRMPEILTNTDVVPTKLLMEDDR